MKMENNELQVIKPEKMKFDLQGLKTLKELDMFISSQPASIFDGLSSLSAIRLFIMTTDAGYSRFTQWLEKDYDAAIAAYKSVSSQKNFGRGGFVERFADLAFDPR